MKVYEVVSPNQWKFNDGIFTFWTALYGSWANDKQIVFRVRSDNTPRIRASEKSIKYYDRLLPSTDQQIQAWFDSHPDYIGNPL